MIAFSSNHQRIPLVTAVVVQLAIAIVLGAGDARAQLAEVPQESTVSRASQTATDGPVAGQRLYLDSRTGALTTVAPPPGAALRLEPHEIDMLSTSDAGLVVRRSAAGGLSVHLDGRFRHVTTATVGAEGKVELGCAGPGSTTRDAAASSPHEHGARP